ncbi:hypothetical protein [Arenibacter latericius]|nr:hypothetical protein [Arenibacter latericius]
MVALTQWNRAAFEDVWKRNIKKLLFYYMGRGNLTRNDIAVLQGG